jgi:phage gp16-like protein
LEVPKDRFFSAEEMELGQVIHTLDHQVNSSDELELRESVAASSRTSIQKLSPEEWLKEWEEVIAAVSKVWPAGVSAVDVVSEMRR